MLPFILCLFVTASKAESGPRFLETASNVMASVGDTAVLPCAVSDLSHYTVIWRGAEEFPLTIGDLTFTNDDRISVQRPYLKDFNLVIRDVRLEDSGQYKCQISTVPAMTRSVTLNVTDPRPRFLETARNVTATVGDTAVLPCAVSDLQDYQVQWLDPDQRMLSINDRRMVNDFRMSVERPYQKDWTLVIRGVDMSDSGQYQCQVDTSPVMSQSVTLRVLVSDPRPRFLETARNVTATVGDIAVLPCAVSDLQDYKVVWLNEHYRLLTYMDRRIVDDQRISVERPYVKDWNLHIRDVRLSDSGEYLCQVNTSPVMITSVFLTVTVAGQDEVTSGRPRYDDHDVMNGSMSYNVTWASGQDSATFLATMHWLLLSAALVNWVCWF